MSTIKAYKDLVHSDYEYRVITTLKTVENRKVQIFRDTERISYFQRLINIIEALAAIIFSLGLLLAFKSVRNYCWNAFIKPREYEVPVSWKSLPFGNVVDAVKKNGLLLEHADDELKDETALVKLAIRQNGLALQFASDRLRENLPFCEIALAQCPQAAQFVKKRPAENKPKADLKPVSAEKEVVKNQEPANIHKEVEKPKDVQSEIKAQEITLKPIEEEEVVRKPYSGLILGEILSFLPYYLRKPLLEWDEAKKAMEEAACKNCELLKCHKEKLVSFLDPIQFADELKQIDEVELNLRNGKEFAHCVLGPDIIEDLIINSFFKIFLLDSNQPLTDKIKKLLLNKDFVLQGISIYKTFKFIPEELRSNKSFVLEAVKRNYKFYQELSNEMKEDRDIVLAAVKKNGHVLGDAPKKFLEDEEIVLEAVKRTGHVIQIVKKIDKTIALAAVSENGAVLQFVPKELRDDEIVLTAVSMVGRMIEFASEVQKKNPVIALAAVRNEWKESVALKYLSNELKDDDKLVMEAVINSPNSVEFASPRLKKNRELALAAVKGDGGALQYLPDWSDDQEIVSIAVRNQRTSDANFEILKFVSERLRGDEEIVLEALKNNGCNLEFACEAFKKNRKFVLAAVSSQGYALCFADASYKEDREIVETAVKNEGTAISFASPGFKKDRTIALMAVKRSGNALYHLDESLKDDKDVVLAAVTRPYGSEYLQYASKRLQNDPEVIAAAKSVKEYE